MDHCIIATCSGRIKSVQIRILDSPHSSRVLLSECDPFGDITVQVQVKRNKFEKRNILSIIIILISSERSNLYALLLNILSNFLGTVRNVH